MGDERARLKRALLASAARTKSRYSHLFLVATLTALRHPKSALQKLLSAGRARQCRVELIEKLRVASERLAQNFCLLLGDGPILFFDRFG